MPKAKGERPPQKNPKTADEQLAECMATFYDDPLAYVMFNFPWDDPTAGIQQVELQEPYKSRFGCQYGPDVWACEFLDNLGAEIKKRGFDGINPVLPIQKATTSGHGIGKSVLVAWLIKFILDTRPFSKGVVTATTDAQLRTKTWAEVGKWHKLSLTEHWFSYNTGRGAMSLCSKIDGERYKETWRCDAQTCREENSEAFAGLHAANSTPFYIFDEASGVPDKIYEVREGGTTDGEPMVFDFGNPTRNTGRFYEECQGRFKHRFIVTTIDSRNVAITNKPRIQEWIDDYGEDSDFVKVRVRGLFPAAGSTQFIPSSSVLAAMSRPALAEDRNAPLIIGVDVARFGDDNSVIWARVGNDARSFPPEMFSGLDTVALTGKVIEKIRFFRDLGKNVAGLFVDNGGIGGAIIDNLRSLGYSPMPVNFGGAPTDGKTYRYKVDEMYGKVKQALLDNLLLPSVKEKGGIEIKDQLTQREYGYTIKGQINLESKGDMKERLGNGVGSPDIADALALTYAFDVATPKQDLEPARAGTAWDYDPLKTNW